MLLLAQILLLLNIFDQQCCLFCMTYARYVHLLQDASPPPHSPGKVPGLHSIGHKVEQVLQVFVWKRVGRSSWALTQLTEAFSEAMRVRQLRQERV
jgi:hypothetical protein